MTTNYLIPAECSREGCIARPVMVIVQKTTKRHLVGCASHWANTARILDGADPEIQVSLEDKLVTAQIVNEAIAAEVERLAEIEFAEVEGLLDDPDSEGS